MKRVTTGGDINFNVADVKGLGDNYAFRFYTTDSCKYIVKVDGDAVEDIIRLEWEELKTLGDGVLNYCGENLEPDEEYSDVTFNRTFGGTTQWYIVTSCSGGGGGGSSEEISELSDRLDAEIERSTEKDEELEDAIDNTYTKAEVDRKIAEAEMGGDVPSGIVIDPNYVHTDNNYTTADRSKLDGIAAGAEVNVQADWNVTDSSSDAYIKNKPDFAGLSNRVTATEDSIDLIINQYIEGLTDDVSDLQNGTYRKHETYSQTEVDNLIAASAVDVADTLNSESDTDALSANKGHELKDKVDYVYGRLKALYAAMGEIAFWNGKPANLLPDIDWDDTVKHTVTITNNVTHSVITSGGVPVSGSIQVNENSTLTLVIAPENTDYTISNVTANGGTVTDNQDGTFTLTVTVTTSDVTLTINGTTTPTVVNYNISYGTMSNCNTTTAPTTIASGGTATIVFSVDTNYELLQSNINVTNASIVSFTNNTLVIGSATGNVTISATATEVYVPPVEYNISYNLSNCSTPTGETNPTTVVDGQGATIKLECTSGYELLSANIQVTNATMGTLTVSGTVYTLTITNATGNVTITATASAIPTGSYAITYRNLSNCQTTTAPTSIESGGTATIVFSVDNNYELLQSNINVTNASIVSFTNNTLVIGSATGNVIIDATATEIGTMFLKGYFINNQGTLKNENFVVNNTDLTDRLVLSDYILLPNATPASAEMQYGINRNNNTSEIPCCLSLLEKLDEGGYKMLRYWTMGGSTTGRAITITGDSKFAAISAAASAGKLYARCEGFMNSDKTAIQTCSFKWNGSYVFNAASDHYTLTDDVTEFESYT